METNGTPVPRDSPVYREFARLYHLARQLSPTPVDRWNRVLLAGPADHLGGFSPTTGQIRLAGRTVLRHLDPTSTTTTRHERAEAMATVLHEATHAGMETDAPNEPNAVRSLISRGAMEGVAELRTVTDFDLYATAAGHPGLVLAKPQYAGALAAMESLMDQVTGPALDRGALLDQAICGPGAMHFDQLANAAVLNRLSDVVPPRAEDRLHVRAALIATMTHPLWASLVQNRPAETGTMVANEIRMYLNQKIDEIRQHYQAHPRQVFPAEIPNAEAFRAADSKRLAALPAPDPSSWKHDRNLARQPTAIQDTAAAMRVLNGIAPAAGATTKRPSPGQAARSAGQQPRQRDQEPRERD